MKTLKLEFADEPGRYNSEGYCFFKLVDGRELCLSPKDCVEVFATRADIDVYEFDRDKIAREMDKTFIDI